MLEEDPLLFIVKALAMLST